ncbi:MAG: hypothetical protein Fur0016_20800 [Anaerolineales bacterium]
MNIVDSSGWLEYLGDLPNAHFFESAAQDSENLLVPTIILYEVYERLSQISSREAARDAVGIMSDGKIVDLDAGCPFQRFAWGKIYREAITRNFFPSSTNICINNRPSPVRHGFFPTVTF